jgi:hypothetical protein
MSVDALQLTQIPTVHVGMLVHKPPSEAFQAFVDPAITTKFWFTRSSEPPRVYRRLWSLSAAVWLGSSLRWWAASNSAGGT